MNLILVRHGEIDANLHKIYAGRSDDCLNEKGRSQADIAGTRLANSGIDALYSSPLRRAIETANIIGNHVSCRPKLLDAFNELVMGPWEGLSEAEVAERYPNELAVWISRPAELRIPGRETLGELQERALRGLREIRRDVPDASRVAVVSHVAVIRVLLLRAYGRNLNDYKKIDVPNATPLEVDLTSLGL